MLTQTGVDYDALGVTFLGAQEITSDRTLEGPLGVSSGGFGPQVQPGQAVVNYMITPDADGDGIDELMVVNTASVAPNGDVISDPIPQAQLGSTVTVNRSGTATLQPLQTGVRGPPGTQLEFDVDGFNPGSFFGNVAVFSSLVDDTEIELPGSIQAAPGDQAGQLFSTIIPPLPAGAATLTLRNDTTGSSVGPIEVTVEAAPTLSRPAIEVIDEFLADTLGFVSAIDASSEQAEAARDEALAALQELRLQFAELASFEDEAGAATAHRPGYRH